MREVSQGKYNMRAVLAECACAGFVFVFSLSTYLAVASTRDDPLEHPYFLQTNLLYPAVFAAGHGMGTADIDKIPGRMILFINGRCPSISVISRKILKLLRWTQSLK